jgi:hypothetical protein
MSTALPLLDGEPSQKPGVVALRVTRGDDRQLCTGVLLLPNLVLTARHCLTLPPIGIEDTRCATTLISPMSEQTQVSVIDAADVDVASEKQRHDVVEALLPTESARLCGEDLALARLAEELDSSTLALTQQRPTAGATFTSVGYGLQSGDYGKQRLTTKANVLCSGLDCVDERVVENEFLAASGACEGDSGGPAIDENGNVFGILSRSTTNCERSAYLDFSKHFAWLATVVREVQSESSAPLPSWAKALEPSGKPDGGEVPPSSDDSEDTDSDRTPELQVTGGCAMSIPKTQRGVATLIPFLMLTPMARRRRPSQPGRTRKK